MLTSYYANPEVGKLVGQGWAPVRISLGAPRFFVPYKPKGKAWACIPELVPVRELLGLPKKEYKKIYTSMLDDENDEENFIDKIGMLGDNTIFLCFCKPENWCHRQFFAEWYEKKTGEKINEL